MRKYFVSNIDQGARILTDDAWNGTIGEMELTEEAADQVAGGARAPVDPMTAVLGAILNAIISKYGFY